ncbi:hypothetical protein [Sphingobacterium griseoflavum]|uniref:LTXXQ motif family protein n=1 Tax=Sphingobacterium griseoflavum TaxID=1474952 RepID=A0ABQ3I414_9SPHI|nr:hypothetical protein [Sphingobacterium griseoflavum]GHE48510.1 hypothetical protein GCM10017764_34400 [Sphingobacterium griseoflavum]
MKKILSLVILFAGIGLTTFAQEQPTVDSKANRERKHPRQERRVEHRSPEEVAKLKTDRLDKHLNFTDEQRAAVFAVQLDQAKRQIAYRTEISALQKKWRQEAKGTKQELAQILTAEQQNVLKEKFAGERKDRMMRKPGGFKGRNNTNGEVQRDIDVAG